MDEQLLSIGEAAKLMGVCENTLRDWDIEDKFKASRTTGGHRRYSLGQIRKYLDEYPPQAEEQPRVLFKDHQIDKLTKQWEESEYLHDWLPDMSESDRRVLPALLETCKVAYEFSTIEPSLSSSQALWLTREAWLRSKFRRMVCVQPLLGPCGLAFVLKRASNGLDFKLESEPVAAKISKYGFQVFLKARFDAVKDLYADCMAEDIDQHILEHLPKFSTEVLQDIPTSISGTSLSNAYNWLIGPEGIMEALKGRKEVEGVDLFPIQAVLDRETYVPISAGGRYPGNGFTSPIFMPYVLMMEGPRIVGPSCISLLMRTGWYDGKNKDDIELPY
jgi:DNA-binding transcriptional MerR regulator